MESGYRFWSFKFAQKRGFSIKDYTTVQTGTITPPKDMDDFNDLDALESLYETMNTNYEAHKGIPSMSMSDIVVLSDNATGTEMRFYYCDRFGFRKLSMDELLGMEVM
jgi:hypothetical protein